MEVDNINEIIDEFVDQIKPIDELLADYKCAIMEVETKFKVLDQQFSVAYDGNPIESIKSRVKSWDSIIKKLKRKNFPISLESIEKNLFDVAGVRVICSFEDDIYRLAKCILDQDDIILVEVKDYIKKPKSNGYRSLHLIIKVPVFTEEGKKFVNVEVQLRTIAMDFWASLEHKLRYKKELDSSVIAKLSDDLYECALVSASLDAKMASVRKEIVRGN